MSRRSPADACACAYSVETHCLTNYFKFAFFAFFGSNLNEFTVFGVLEIVTEEVFLFFDAETEEELYAVDEHCSVISVELERLCVSE